MPKNSKKRKRAESRPTRLNMKALFEAGDGYGLSRNDVKAALDKHMSCNWGDVNDDRWAWNDEAYKSGGEAISLHKSGNGDAFMIITEVGGTEISVFKPAAQIIKKSVLIMLKLNVEKLMAAIAETEMCSTSVEFSRGVQYLCKRFYNPIASGAPMRFRDIDFDEFELEDVGGFQDYYNKTLCDQENTAYEMCNVLSKMSPKASKANFI